MRREQSLDEREDIRDRIISRKVEDLLSDRSAEWQSEASPRDTYFDVIGIGDVIEQLQTDLVAKKQLLEESASNLKQTQQLFQTGVTSATALGEARSQFTQQESAYTKAKQKFDQYAKISKRWKEIVGDALAGEPDSKQRVDKRSDR